MATPYHVEDVVSWRADLAAVQQRIGGYFGCAEPRERVGRYLTGLLS